MAGGRRHGEKGQHPMSGGATLRPMNVGMTKPWTAEQFLNWAARQKDRYEFDGIGPVAMTGGSANHNRISHKIYAAPRSRPRGTPCSHFGPDLGVRTTGESVRYPDALITCTKFPGTERLAPDVVIIFEVVSSDSGRRDRIEKVREYASVASVRRSIIVESLVSGLLVLYREQADAAFTVLTLTGEDMVSLPEVGVQIPVAEFYEDVEFAEAGAAE